MCGMLVSSAIPNVNETRKIISERDTSGDGFSTRGTALRVRILTCGIFAAAVVDIRLGAIIGASQERVKTFVDFGGN
jgi:hypothetical protein